MTSPVPASPASPTVLWHASAWTDLAAAQVGDTLTLRPGSQTAEGRGVYFSEDAPRPTAAEGAKGSPTVLVRIETTSGAGWWRTKLGVARKAGRPRTWHSDGKSVTLLVLGRESGHPSDPVVLRCAWTFKGWAVAA